METTEGTYQVGVGQAAFILLVCPVRVMLRPNS